MVRRILPYALLVLTLCFVTSQWMLISSLDRATARIDSQEEELDCRGIVRSEQNRVAGTAIVALLADDTLSQPILESQLRDILAGPTPAEVCAGSE